MAAIELHVKGKICLYIYTGQTIHVILLSCFITLVPGQLSFQPDLPLIRIVLSLDFVISQMYHVPLHLCKSVFCVLLKSFAAICSYNRAYGYEKVLSHYYSVSPVTYRHALINFLALLPLQFQITYALFHLETSQ